MKNILIAITTLLLFACKNKKSLSPDELTGKWVVTEIPSSSNLSKTESAEMIGKATIEFHPDGKYTAADEDGTETGIFTYDKKSSSLTMISPENDTTKVSISLKNGVLIFVSKEGEIRLRKE